MTINYIPSRPVSSHTTPFNTATARLGRFPAGMIDVDTNADIEQLAVFEKETSFHLQ
jgi:hypothetical protein